MMVFALIIVAVVLSVAAIAVLNVYGIPIVLLVLIALAVYLLSAKRRGESLGTREVVRGPGPTGRPRASHGAPDTANERQGQI